MSNRENTIPHTQTHTQAPPLVLFSSWHTHTLTKPITSCCFNRQVLSHSGLDLVLKLSRIPRWSQQHVKSFCQFKLVRVAVISCLCSNLISWNSCLGDVDGSNPLQVPEVCVCKRCEFNDSVVKPCSDFISPPLDSLEQRQHNNPRHADLHLLRQTT